MQKTVKQNMLHRYIYPIKSSLIYRRICVKNPSVGIAQQFRSYDA